MFVFVVVVFFVRPPTPYSSFSHYLSLEQNVVHNYKKNCSLQLPSKEFDKEDVLFQAFIILDMNNQSKYKNTYFVYQGLKA